MDRIKFKDYIKYFVVTDSAYGALGDGITDDTEAIQAAMDAASLVGGKVVFPSGTYLISSALTLKSNTYLEGVGTATIKLANGSNKTVIQGENFLSLSGTNSGSGISSFAIRNLIIDGNRSNNSLVDPNEGHGIAFYGRNFIIDNVVCKNTVLDGYHAEYGNTDVGTSPFAGKVTRVLTDTTGTTGFYNNVSDTHLYDLNVRSAGLSTNDTYYGIHLGSHGSIRGGGINVWSGGSETSWPKYALFAECDGATIQGIHLETGYSANHNFTGDSNQIVGMLCYNYKTSTNGIVSGSKNYIQAKYNNGAIGSTTATAVKLGESGDSPVQNTLNIEANNHNTALVDFTYSGGGNIVYINGTQDAGTNVVGWTQSTDLVFGRVGGSVARVYSGGRGDRSVQLGDLSSAATSQSTAIGYFCTVSGTGGIALGNQSSSVNTGAVAIGTNCTTGNQYAVSMGIRAKSTLYGETCHASFQASTTGDRQTGKVRMGVTTTNTTPTDLSCSGSGSERFLIGNNSIVNCRVRLIGVDSADSTKFFKGSYDLLIKKDTTSASTSIIGTTSTSLDAGNFGSYSAALSADTANGALKITVTGASTVYWFAEIDYAKVVK